MRNQRNPLLRRILFLLSFVLLVMLLYLSVKRQPVAEGTPSATHIPALPDLPAERMLTLPLLSANATASNSHITNLFDQDASTQWLLARGSGPGECLEIHFLPQNMPFLSGLRIAPTQTDTLSDVKKIALYVNHELSLVKEENFDFPIGKKVFALQICIEGTRADEVYSYVDGDQLISIHTLPRDQQTGLQSLSFFDKEGQAFYPVTPRYISANVVPSSNLNPVSAFHAGQLFDGQTSSAWIEGEGAATSPSSIQIELSEAIQPSALALWNGYQLSDLHFQNNSRVAGISLSANGIPLVSSECRDQSGGQILALPSDLRLLNFSIDIDERYPGNRYPETAISELCFLEGVRPVVLQTTWPQMIRRELALQISQTPLQFYLNRPITNRIEHTSGDYYYRNQLCLQSDGRFYASLEHNQRRQNNRTLFDVSGHWEIQQADEEQTRLRLFGKAERTNFVANTTPAYEEILFNEMITLRVDRIEGGEHLGRFYLR